MNATHKVCNRCSVELSISDFREGYRKGVDGKPVLYRNSYCYPCEKERQREYNAKRVRKEGTLTVQEYREIQNKGKQQRLERLRKEKELRKQERDKVRQEKLELKRLAKEKRAREAKAKWEANWGAWNEEHGERIRLELMEEAAQARKALLDSGVKHCTGCDQEKPLHRFHSRNRKRKDGSNYVVPYSKCKDCRRVSNLKYEHTPKAKRDKRKRAALRDRRSKQATPKWLTPEQKQQIVATYEHMRDCRAVTGEEYHVDHIVPLRGENVCGLHVPWNLQVLPACVNMSKSNNT